MPRQTLQKRVRAVRPRADKRRTTRQLLLEAAGEVFAGRGFDRATGGEICEPFDISPALISYYFGGMEGLYTAVLAEAGDRLAVFESFLSELPESLDAEGRLRALMKNWADTILGARASSWMFRVSVREFVNPTPMSDALRAKHPLPWMAFLRENVGELMGLSPEHPAVSRGCLAVTAPLMILMIADRHGMKSAFPRAGFTARGAGELVDDLVVYAVAGLAALGEAVVADPAG